MSEFWAFEFETGYYDKILEDGLNKNRGIQAGWHNITFSLLNKYVEENNVHLDYACGPGTFIGKYVKKNSLGIDLSKDQIEYASDKYGKHGKFYTISEFDITNYENHFDIITVAGLLEFIRPDEAIELISNLQKSLKKNGRIILTTPNYGWSFIFIQKIVYIFSGINYEDALITKYNSKMFQSLNFEDNFKYVSIKKFMTIGWILSFINLDLGNKINAYFENKTHNRYGFLFLIEIKRDN